MTNKQVPFHDTKVSAAMTRP